MNDIDYFSNYHATLQQDLTNCRFDIANQEQMNALQAADIDMLGLMRGCEQAPEFMKEEDLKPDGFPITD
jgi:hypothetical protein